jgi:hypothetical protein
VRPATVRQLAVSRRRLRARAVPLRGRLSRRATPPRQGRRRRKAGPAGLAAQILRGGLSWWWRLGFGAAFLTSDVL